MAGFRFRSSSRRTLLACVAWSALVAPALAGDLPPTSAGASAIAGVFKTYFGASPSVAPQGAGYSVSVDFTAPAALFGGSDIKIEPVKIAFMLFAQDDGSWRVEQKDLPPMSWRSKTDDFEMNETVSLTGFKQVSVYDPKIAGVRSGDFSADKVAVVATIPNGKENIDVSGVKGAITGAGGADGSLSGAIKQTFDALDFTFVADDKGKDAAQGPMTVTGKGGGITSDAKFDGLKSHALLDLWAFMVAHPQRADLAANEAAFKTLLAAAAAGQPSASNDFAGAGFTFATSRGGGASFDKLAGGVSIAAKGPQSHFEEHFGFSGISLPEGLVPAAYKDLVPTAVDIGVKLSNFDLNAAVQEAITDIKLAGDGPWIDKDAHDKMVAKLIGAGPLVIEIPTSHVVSPVLDLTVDGRAEYGEGGKPVGKITIRMRNFDKTVAALKSLGEDAQQKIVPMLAMAKGLGKADGDALVWVCEIGADRVMKVNGLPLGKAPI